jgi:hypothetical protein
MTNYELITKLEQAQYLLSEIYHWANTEMSNGLQVSPLKINAEIATLMSAADGCICEALDELRWDDK